MHYINTFVIGIFAAGAVVAYKLTYQLPLNKPETKALFGLSNPWKCLDWKTVDDRVRGGSSISNLKCNHSNARFHGSLDTTTLGGAGFASQKYKFDHVLDASLFDGILINAILDEKTYSLNIVDSNKDLIYPEGLRPDGRQKSVLQFKATFKSKRGERLFFLPWSEFLPSYRGRPPKNGNHQLNIGEIKEMSLMMQSFFDDQSGDFDSEFISIELAKIHNRTVRP